MPKKRKPTVKMELTTENIKQALHDLDIDQPIRLVRVVGNRLELHLPWAVVSWPETRAERRHRLAAKPKPLPPHTPTDSEDLRKGA